MDEPSPKPPNDDVGDSCEAAPDKVAVRLQHAPRETPANPHRVELRAAIPDEMARSLRAMLGLAPDEPAPGELAADLRRPLPPVVHGLDAGAWIAWCLAGLPLFAGGLPNLRRVKATGSRVVMALAMLRSGGNITRASAALRTSRKVLRDNLRLLDLYPWNRSAADEQGEGGRR